MIYYFKLFDMLNRRGMKKTDLLEIISSPTLAKLSKGEIVKTDIIDRICLFLGCQPGDIMECVADRTEPGKFKKVKYATYHYDYMNDEIVETTNRRNDPEYEEKRERSEPFHVE